MLRLQNVKKSFVEPGGGRLPILDISQFDVAAGEQMVLVGRSFIELSHVPIGFTADHALSLQLSLPPSDYTDRDRIERFAQALRIRFGTPVEMFDPFRRVVLDAKKSWDTQRNMFAATATVAVGLALRWAGDG